MAITTDDFNKIWASTSPLTPYSFSESQYKEGWNFIGSTPPSRQMWDYLQKNNDEKMQYLANNYLPLNGGTLTGDVFGVTPPNGDNSKKLATTAFVNATAQQADWNVTDSSSKAFIKNKPAVYPCAKTLEIEDTRAQTNTPSFFINNYNRRIKSDFKREDSPEAETFSSFITITPWDNNTGGYPSQLAFTERGNIFYRIGSSDEKWGNWKRIPLEGETIDFNKPVKENGGFLVPIGVVQAFAGSTIPTGWLLCDGSAVSRTDYAALFAVIGTTYGAGNGSSTFNLPNLVDKFVEGSATAGTVKSAGLPNITGTLLGSGSYSINNPSYFTGAFAYTNAVKSKTFGSDEKNEKWNSAADFNASRSSAIYGASDTVQPPALTMRYIIKY